VNKLPAYLLVCFVGVVIFLAGLVLGVYYHAEFTVLWLHQFSSSVPATSATPPPIDLNTSSVIRLPTLPDPIPLIYSDTLDEATIQQHLKQGAVVLPLGTAFGEPGNVVITAHSSGTESFGPYRFAFSQLSELAVGSSYSISTPTANYNYRVYAKEIVWPHEVDKLPQGDRSTVTLVTCWPLWTNFQRLLVHSELTGVDYNL
jgi:sortase A